MSNKREATYSNSPVVLGFAKPPTPDGPNLRAVCKWCTRWIVPKETVIAGKAVLKWVHEQDKHEWCPTPRATPEDGTIQGTIDVNNDDKEAT